MRKLFSLVYWTTLVVLCAVFFVGALAVFLVTRPFDRNGVVLHLYSCLWAQAVYAVNPLWSLTVEGREHLPWRGAAVLVSNHESLADILMLFGLYRPFKWVSKASVFNVPLVGWNMRLNGYVSLVRGQRESIVRMMADCRRWLERGVPVLLFPEGTRSPDGEVKAFKDGAFRLAIDEGCPVIPIAITGTANLLPKHGLVLETKGHCHVRVLEPVSPEPFHGDVAALREHVRGLIVEEKARMHAAQEKRAKGRGRRGAPQVDVTPSD